MKTSTNQIEVSVNIAKVSQGTTKSGRPFGVVEGVSPDVGIFRVFCPADVAEKALQVSEFDKGIMIIEVCTNREFGLIARCVDFDIK